MSPAPPTRPSSRAALAERLPAYMVPAAVVVLDALPLTPNGKLDTRALPAPEYSDADRYRAPANAIEEILAGIYAQVLGLERVGVDDSFFELGGDSILSMQVVARARAAGLTCRPRDIFVEQTVARLARVVAVADGAGGPIDEGVGPVLATPIMRWLQPGKRGRPGRPVQPDDGGAGPAGGRPRPTWWSCCRPCWIGTPCCGCASTEATGGRGLVVAGARTGCGGCRASACNRWTCCPMTR